MKNNNVIKQVVATGIGIALFAVLTNAQIPAFIVPNTSLQVRMAVLAFFSAIFGPVVGGVIGFAGHALGDALFYGGVWWSWVIPEAVVGIAIGLFAKKFAVEEGGFTTVKNILLFNVVQIIANAVAWILLAPALDVLIYSEPKNKVISQGVVAFVLNIIIIAILGTILLAAYSKIQGGSKELKVEE